MSDRTLLIDEAQRQIAALRMTGTRITLLALSAPSLPASVVSALVRSASSPLDLVGDLGDGSFGLLSLHARGPEGGAGVEHRFLLRLQGVLAPLATRHNIGVVQFRAVHRWASELTDWTDLFASLRDAPAIPLSIPPEPRPAPLDSRHGAPVSQALRLFRHSSASADGQRT